MAGLEPTREKHRENTGISNYFLNRTLIAQETRARINKWNCIKLKKPLHSKGNNYQNQEWKKIFASCLLDKELLSRTYRVQKIKH
jgi:hypothetical protein